MCYHLVLLTDLNHLCDRCSLIMYSIFTAPDKFVDNPSSVVTFTTLGTVYLDISFTVSFLETQLTNHANLAAGHALAIRIL